jgi:hypothetical protein
MCTHSQNPITLLLTPQDLYRISRQLASVVVPHEYGLDEHGKLLIGSKICAELLGKLLCDLESMKVRGCVGVCVGGGCCGVQCWSGKPAWLEGRGWSCGPA